MSKEIIRAVTGGYMHWCPGCYDLHIIPTSDPYKIHWDFNNNLEFPTFSPSVKHNWTERARSKPDNKVCHYHIENGLIKYCNDCTHSLSDKTIPLPELPKHLDNFQG